MLDTATELNAEARKDQGGAANVQLGYLIGAAQRGAEVADGIHAELMRRLIAAATYSPGPRSALEGLRARLPTRASTRAWRRARKDLARRVAALGEQAPGQVPVVESSLRFEDEVAVGASRQQVAVLSPETLPAQCEARSGRASPRRPRSLGIRLRHPVTALGELGGA